MPHEVDKTGKRNKKSHTVSSAKDSVDNAVN